MYSWRLMSKRHADATSDATTLAAYLRQIAKAPQLSADEERSLGVRIRRGRDEAAVSQLVQSHLRFVVRCAKRYLGCGVSMLDLIHEGNLGLIEAARRFDPSRNVKFISEAAWWVRQSMVHAMSNGTRACAFPPKALATRERQAFDALSHPKASMRQGLRRDELADLLVQDHMGVDEGTMGRSDWHELADALHELGGKQQKVARLRFGLDEDEPGGLQEAADRPLLSRDAIRQSELRAKGKLQQVARLRSHLN
jgi:RNA polymerase primary sigma factor